MKKTNRLKPQKLPKGWTHARIQGVIEYYDNQTDDEAVIEAEEGLRTSVGVPAHLVDDVRKFLANAIVGKPGRKVG